MDIMSIAFLEGDQCVGEIMRNATGGDEEMDARPGVSQWSP
jgi:hypothetical protein